MPIQAIKEVSDLIGRGDTLSTSLRLTKYAKIGDKNEKKIAVEFFCSGKTLDLKPSLKVPNSETFVMKLGARLIINQAGGVLENAGLCIHRHFGYPYIPGSALKGIARHAAWLDWVDEEDETAKLEIAKKIALTFGYPTNDKGLDNYLAELQEFQKGRNGERDGKFAKFAGSVAFMAATPEGSATLESDVLTCHHMKYYSGEIDKALDTEDPNPQFFPTVAEGTSFRFTLIPLRNSQNSSENLVFAKEYLKKGIEELGIGAKTAAGYGWFQEDPAVKKAEELRIAEEKKLTEEAEQKTQEKAERNAFLKKIEEENEIKRLHEEKERENQRKLKVDTGLSVIKDDIDLGRILAQAMKFKDALNKELADTEKNELIEILKNSYTATKSKDKKWKPGKKSKETWKKIKVLLDDELCGKLKEELT